MEKILIGAYLSVLVAFITAVMSVVKLVNEKESKTTDYRQSWTDSVRVALSQLIGGISLQANLICLRIEIANDLNEVHNEHVEESEQKMKDALAEYLQTRLTDVNKDIAENRQSIEKNYALASLHFKPNDDTYARIEQNFDSLKRLLSELFELHSEPGRIQSPVLKEKINAGVTELTGVARHILKTEWEHVKAGEPAYKLTKNWSFYIGVAAFSVLTFAGIYMLAYTQAASAIVGESKSIGNVEQDKNVKPLIPSEATSSNAPQQIVNIQQPNTPACAALQFSRPTSTPKVSCIQNIENTSQAGANINAK